MALKDDDDKSVFELNHFNRPFAWRDLIVIGTYFAKGVCETAVDTLDLLLEVVASDANHESDKKHFIGSVEAGLEHLQVKNDEDRRE
jgi:hypothetical protein